VLIPKLDVLFFELFLHRFFLFVIVTVKRLDGFAAAPCDLVIGQGEVPITVRAGNEFFI